MVEHGTYLVKDSYEDRWFLERAPGWGYPKIIVEKLAKIVKGHEAAFKLARKHGVKIAFGTDAGGFDWKINPAEEFPLMVKYGMTPIQAIRSATTVASELLGMQSQIGTVEAGKYADIVAVQGDPLQDVTVLKNVNFVMKGGEVYKHP
jgi:imidazolonepropionase-like amidohydrolase